MVSTYIYLSFYLLLQSLFILTLLFFFLFFFNDTATTEIYTLSLHDALPISSPAERPGRSDDRVAPRATRLGGCPPAVQSRSEEHTSELQSRFDLVCRLLLEKKKKKNTKYIYNIKTNIETN